MGLMPEIVMQKGFQLESLNGIQPDGLNYQLKSGESLRINGPINPEELPLHRVIDLASLICIAMDYCRNDNNLRSLDDFPVNRSTDDPELKHHINLMSKELNKSERYLNVSLKRLSVQN